MTFRAIAMVPENAAIILKEVDLVIDYSTMQKEYLVTGFGPPVDYDFYSRQEFDRQWRFLFGQEHQGRFSLVMAR